MIVSPKSGRKSEEFLMNEKFSVHWQKTCINIKKRQKSVWYSMLVKSSFCCMQYTYRILNNYIQLNAVMLIIISFLLTSFD